MNGESSCRLCARDTPPAADLALTIQQTAAAGTEGVGRWGRPALLAVVPVVLALGAGTGWAIFQLQSSPVVSTVAASTSDDATVDATADPTASAPAPSATAAAPHATTSTSQPSVVARASDEATDPPTSDTVPSSAGAAEQVSRLLDGSRSARKAVVAATQGLADCRLSADEAASRLQQVIGLRRRLLVRADAVDFGPLSHGAELRSALTQAWQASLDADFSYLGWAQNQRVYGDCDTGDADYLAGNASSARAVAAKKNFASLWNRYVASALNLATRSEEEL